MFEGTNQVRRLSILVFAGTLSLAAMAHSEDFSRLSPVPDFDVDDWAYVTTSSDDAEFFIQFKYLGLGQGTHKVWVRSDHSRNKKLAAREIMMFQEIDCDESTIKLRHMTSYAPDGTIIDSASNAFLPAEPIIPGSTGDAIRKFVCEEF
jgi:hypothetical protein|tara:strand:- start:1308 stop:1754 length:447 start_codon:yes stop_codon:yes gene_type:complete